MTPTLIPLTDLEGLKAAGIAYPKTVHAWRWLHRHRHARGLAEAFPRIGDRILVDVARFIELVRGSTKP